MAHCNNMIMQKHRCGTLWVKWSFELGLKLIPLLQPKSLMDRIRIKWFGLIFRWFGSLPITLMLYLAQLQWFRTPPITLTVIFVFANAQCYILIFVKYHLQWFWTLQITLMLYLVLQWFRTPPITLTVIFGGQIKHNFTETQTNNLCSPFPYKKTPNA